MSKDNGLNVRTVNSRCVTGSLGRLELFRCYAAIDCNMSLLKLFTNEIHYARNDKQGVLV